MEYTTHTVFISLTPDNKSVAIEVVVGTSGGRMCLAAVARKTLGRALDAIAELVCANVQGAEPFDATVLAQACNPTEITKMLRNSNCSGWQMLGQDDGEKHHVSVVLVPLMCSAITRWFDQRITSELTDLARSAVTDEHREEVNELSRVADILVMDLDQMTKALADGVKQFTNRLATRKPRGTLLVRTMCSTQPPAFLGFWFHALLKLKWIEDSSWPRGIFTPRELHDVQVKITKERSAAWLETVRGNCIAQCEMAMRIVHALERSPLAKTADPGMVAAGVVLTMQALDALECVWHLKHGRALQATASHFAQSVSDPSYTGRHRAGSIGDVRDGRFRHGTHLGVCTAHNLEYDLDRAEHKGEARAFLVVFVNGECSYNTLQQELSKRLNTIGGLTQVTAVFIDTIQLPFMKSRGGRARQAADEADVEFALRALMPFVGPVDSMFEWERPAPANRAAVEPVQRLTPPLQGASSRPSRRSTYPLLRRALFSARPQHSLHKSQTSTLASTVDCAVHECGTLPLIAAMCKTAILQVDDQAPAFLVQTIHACIDASGLSRASVAGKLARDSDLGGDKYADLMGQLLANV